ncbi:MAG: hypothetical protein NC433_16870 [Clostridiales bacterium]|nr:hypothetical protein [Clostridiales bacterium]
MKRDILMKIKKRIIECFVLIVMLMVCACAQADVDNAKMDNTIINHMALMPDIIKMIEEAEIIGQEKTAILLQERTTILSQEEQLVYEAYLAAYGDEEDKYTYVDYDNDGKMELYICSSENWYGYVMKYLDGGLMGIGRGTVSQENIEGLEWNEIETDDLSADKNADEWTHEGIDVYTGQNPFEERYFWYIDEKSFLSQYGFAESEPFYVYALPNGDTRLVLYYDEQTKTGCGLRYFERDPSDIMTSGLCGFTFAGLSAGTDYIRNDGLNIDYTKFESAYGDTGSDDVSDYEENIEYDDAGRVVHFDSRGIVYWMNEEEPSYLLQIDYEYDDNGVLRYRQYFHNPNVFGTFRQRWDSYFDELGRLEHEYIYITHGWLDYYYIYLDDSEQPSYCLLLDDNLGWWIPALIKY